MGSRMVQKFVPFLASRRLRRSLALAALAGGVYAAGNTKGDIWANVGAGVRFLRSAKIGLLISIDYTIAEHMFSKDRPDYSDRMSELHRKSAERILEGCLVNGGTYIKIGQGLVSLSHILPKEYVRTLSKLQDKCLVRSEGEVQELFVQDFGRTPDEVFKTFDYEPLAAASLAQVFQATTKDDEKVAVKVQYIDLQRRFTSDIATIHFLVKLAGYAHPKFDFSWILEDVTDNLREELDFINEGRNSERCAADLSGLSYVRVPKVHWDLCSTRVLVMDFVDGVKVSDKEELRRRGFRLDDVDAKLFEAFGTQIFQTGFVHADPHPGNVFVTKRNNETELILLDHGLYEQVTREDRLALSQFWKALVLKDHDKMRKYSTELGVEDYTMLAEILTQRPLRSRGFRLSSKLSEDELQYMADFAQKRFDLIMNTLKEMPRSLLFVTRNLNTIRAIAHDHGDPIDRYTVLARSATVTAFGTQQGFVNKIRTFPVRLYFEYQLLKTRMHMWFIRAYFKVLYVVGRSPDASGLLSGLLQ